jgi:hypothetical protein
MTPEMLADLRRRSVHLRGLAEVRLVMLTDGPGAGSRLLEVRTPDGISADIALDRGGDLFRIGCRGTELGWRSAVDGATPWPVLDSEDGLGFMRGFDGFLVTCGLDHHGVATTTPATDFHYPLRQKNHHPLHGRIMASKAELVEKSIDWQAGVISIGLFVRQASVFGEVLELARTWTFSLTAPQFRLQDRVINRGFRPTRHGILYHINFGHPFLSEATRVLADHWPPADALAVDQITPDDAHVERVDAAPSPQSGCIEVTNGDLNIAVTIAYDSLRLPVTALWRAFQSGVYALAIEPQTIFTPDGADSVLAAGQETLYGLEFTLSHDQQVT